MQRPRGGLTGRLLDAVEERTGLATVERQRLDTLEEAAVDNRILRRELEDLAYTTLDYAAGRPQDLTPEARRRLVQRARIVWMKDPMAGAAIELMNDFVFGRGVPKPKAKDPAVQEVLDDFWDDSSNKRVLTTHERQLALGTDLSLQSNLFFLFFDDGEDGKVRVSLLEHDSVRNVVRDPEDRFCHLWYLATYRREEWDFVRDCPVVDMHDIQDSGGNLKVFYYEHIDNYEEQVELAKSTPGIEPPLRPPDAKIGKGKVYHVAINRTSEMIFGHPRMDRTLRWYTAFNRFMEARVDMMVASAAYIMKRDIKGTPNQLAKQATRALSKVSELSVGTPDPSMPKPGPARGASIIDENESVKHEAFNLQSNAAAAMQDAQSLRSQISAAERFHQGYLGDASALNLSSATTLELPILKAVETRQEFFEDVFREGFDRAIQQAVDKGVLKTALSPAERAQLKKAKGEDVGSAGEQERAAAELQASYEGQPQDEDDTERDLSYEFAMPNPLRRAMGDLVTAATTIAQVFDPNNTNTELSRALLLVCLSDALEIQDAAELVEKIFPPGYVDPAIAAAQAAGQPAPQDMPVSEPAFGEFGPNAAGAAAGADGQHHGPANPYGARMAAQPPEQAMQQARLEVHQGAAWWPRDRHGRPLPPDLVEALSSEPVIRSWNLPADTREALVKQMAGTTEGFAELERDALAVAVPSSNGHGKH